MILFIIISAERQLIRVHFSHISEKAKNKKHVFLQKCILYINQVYNKVKLKYFIC